MNHLEHATLVEIATGKPFEVRPRLLKFLETVKVEEEPKYPKRTDAQRKAYFLWLEQIAEQCQRQQVTADLLFRHTAHITVTENMLHHAIKTLCKVKWNIDSTNDLRKTGHLDDIIDSVASWVGKENIEIPPFPSNETRAMEELSGVRLGAHNNKEKMDYPEQDESTLADKF